MLLSYAVRVLQYAGLLQTNGKIDSKIDKPKTIAGIEICQIGLGSASKISIDIDLAWTKNNSEDRQEPAGLDFLV